MALKREKHIVINLKPLNVIEFFFNVDHRNNRKKSNVLNDFKNVMLTRAHKIWYTKSTR